MRKFFTLIMFLTSAEMHLAECQNAPVTVAATVGGAVPGQTVSVPVTVTSFSDISSVTLYLDYEYSKVQFVSGIRNPLLAGSFAIGDINIGNGWHRVTTGWYTNTSVSLPDGSWLMQFNFTYNNGNAQLLWYDIGPSCNYTNSSGINLNDIPFESYYVNGSICGALNSPGQVTGSEKVCQGNISQVYSVGTLSGAVSYQWNVPAGAAITAGAGTSMILVDYSDTAVSGNVTVCGVNECGNGLLSVLPVEVTPKPVADAGEDTTIIYSSPAYLHATGCGNCSYHWEPSSMLVNPDIQDPVSLPLTMTTIFTVTVAVPGMNCQSSDQVTVTVTGGPLTSNPEASPVEICAGDATHLFANAGGGSGYYSYEWSCTPPGTPAWVSYEANPWVNPETTTGYTVSVSDGIHITAGEVVVYVNPVPQAPVISFVEGKLYSDACCGNQWFLNGFPLTDANGPVYTPLEDGYYSDIVNLSDCFSDTSNVIQVVISNTTIPMSSVLQIIPNPAKDFFLLKCSGIHQKKLRITFFTSEGVLVKEVPVTGNETNSFLVDVRDLSPGLYFVNIKSDDQSLIRKLVII